MKAVYKYTIYPGNLGTEIHKGAEIQPEIEGRIARFLGAESFEVVE